MYRDSNVFFPYLLNRGRSLCEAETFSCKVRIIFSVSLSGLSDEVMSACRMEILPRPVKESESQR